MILNKWGKGIVKSFDLNSQNEFPKAKVFKKSLAHEKMMFYSENEIFLEPAHHMGKGMI